MCIGLCKRVSSGGLGLIGRSGNTGSSLDQLRLVFGVAPEDAEGDGAEGSGWWNDKLGQAAEAGITYMNAKECPGLTMLLGKSQDFQPFYHGSSTATSQGELAAKARELHDKVKDKAIAGLIWAHSL